MKLKKGQMQISLPPFAGIVNVRIEDNMGAIYALMQISSDHMAKLQTDRKDGRPIYFSVEGPAIRIYPRPPEDYEKFFIRYLPCEEEV